MAWNLTQNIYSDIILTLDIKYSNKEIIPKETKITAV